MSRRIPKSNYILTAKEIRKALANFSTALRAAKAVLADRSEKIPFASGDALALLAEECRYAADFIKEHEEPLRDDVRDLHEDALAHLMHHYMATEPDFKAKMSEEFGHLGPIPERKLSAKKFRHYEDVSDLTGAFLEEWDT